MVDFFTDAFPQNTDALLEEFIRSIEKDLEKLRSKDLETISSCLNKLNYKKGMNEPFITKLMTYADESLTADRLNIGAIIKRKYNQIFISARSFLQFQIEMARLGHYHQNHLNHILATVNSSDELKRAESFMDIMECGMRILLRIEGIYDTPQNYEAIHNELKKNIKLNRAALSAIFKLDCQIEVDCPEYTGSRLSKNDRHKLSSLLERQPDHSIDLRIMKNVLHDICRIFNIPYNYEETDLLYHGYISPDSVCRDVVFCADVKSSSWNEIKLIPLPNEYVYDLNEGQRVVWPDKYSISNDNRAETTSGKYKCPNKTPAWFAITAPQNKFHRTKSSSTAVPDSVFTESDRYYSKGVGPHQLRIERLENLGYNVIVLSHKILEDCKNRRGIHDLRKLLNKVCVQDKKVIDKFGLHH